MMIDTHCHLDSKDYDNIEEVIKHMENNIMIVSTASPSDIKDVVTLCEKYNNIYGTIGIHPEFADSYNSEDLKNVEKYLKHPKIVGIGEVGLDYHYRQDNKEKQKELFIKQINLANSYHKPLVIHSRDSLEDTYNILAKYKDKDLKGIMHCFSGDVNYAKKIVNLNMYLGIGGILTFKKEKKLKEVVKTLDVQYLVLETDSPYLTPEPFRGKKNEPVNIKYVALKIAELKKEKIGKILEITTENALGIFDLKL